MPDKDKNEIMIIDEQSLRDKIYVIRGQQVMLDFDLAEIYGYSVSAFNQQVRRNINRFSEDFLFELSNEEMIQLSKSQNVISIQTTGVKGGRSKPVKAFTEAGYLKEKEQQERLINTGVMIPVSALCPFSGRYRGITADC